MPREEKIEHIYDIYFARIYRFFFYKTLSREEAEDLTSDTFLGLVKQLKAGHEVSDIERYLYGIARNTFFSFLRRKYQLRQVSLGDMPDIAIEIENVGKVDIDLTKLAGKLISALPAKQREILHMRLIERRSLSEICAILGKDMSYVKTTQRRGIRSLKQRLVCTPITTYI